MSSSNLLTSRGDSSRSSLSETSEHLNGDTCNHRASNAGFAAYWSDIDRFEGRVDGIRTVEDAARKTREIEAGPLLQAENILNTGCEKGRLKRRITIPYQKYKKYKKECSSGSSSFVAVTKFSCRASTFFFCQKTASR
jgi:hypothetical protein